MLARSDAERFGREQFAGVGVLGGETPKMAADYPWFAIRVESQCERLVSDTLRQRGYEEFFPQYWSRRLCCSGARKLGRAIGNKPKFK